MSKDSNKQSVESRRMPPSPRGIPPEDASLYELPEPHSGVDSKSESTVEERPDQPDLATLRSLRKKLAELIVEFEQLVHAGGKDWESRLRIALLQVHVDMLREKDDFTDLEDIKSLTRLETDLEKWMKKCLQEGKFKLEPVEEMRLVCAGVGEMLLEVFNLFERTLQ